jgi:photosystem II stability/assembly factor-like uncharacterized protein
MKSSLANKILLSLVLVLAACSSPRVTLILSMALSPTTTITVTPSPLTTAYIPLPHEMKMTTAPNMTNNFLVSHPTYTLLFIPTRTATIPPFSYLHIMLPQHWVDALNGWATTREPDSESLLLRTTDGGYTWQDVTPPISSLNYSFLDENNVWGVYYLPEGKVDIYHTGDGGRTWQVFSAPFSFAGVHFFDANRGLAIAPQDYAADHTRLELYTTSDGGQSWDQYADTPVFAGDKVYYHYPNFSFSNVQILSFQSSSDFWMKGGLQKAGTYISFMVSHDAGQSWQSQDIAIPEGLGTISIDAPVFLNKLDGFISVRYTGSGESFKGTLIYSSRDGGITWSKCSSVSRSSTYAMHFISLVDWVIELGHSLFITHDGGQNWQEQPLPLSPDGGYKSYFSDPQHGWLIINHLGQQFYRTQDGGKTWQPFNPVIQVP